MAMRYPFTVLCLLSLFTASSAHSAGEHAAAPMMAAPQKALNQQDWDTLDDQKTASAATPHLEIVNVFRSVYKTAGEPSIAIFWNRKFDDQLSQWEAVARRSVTGEASVNSADVFKKQGDVKDTDILGTTVSSMNSVSQPSGESLGSYQRNVKGGSRILAAEYAEIRLQQARRKGMGEVRDFEFGSGYMQPFFEGSAKILDRKAIMRLVERDNAREAGSEMIADYQKVETDALVGYAEYLAEIVFSSDSAADLGMSFMVSVKEVATGRVVAMFKSDGKPPKKTDQPVRYLATAGGYEKAEYEDAPPSPEEVGSQLAYETMEALSKFWKTL